MRQPGESDPATSEGVSRADMQRVHTRDLYDAADLPEDQIARSVTDIAGPVVQPKVGDVKMVLRFVDGLAEAEITTNE